MSSLLPAFEYDIFISYRHNDNRSGWVTEFVRNLQEELGATLKDSVSIYFDTNPHDGLLETHHVDKSLEGKLNCIIFIPILSQTYCDPKSFAWQHEFCVFNRKSRKDSLGGDIRLNNGNVTSRILPVRIHDLDAEDTLIIENETGGVLRAIDFIYKEPGVNRPLKPEDSRSYNLNKTDYRNQVNKVANAVKEIITALRNPVSAKSPGVVEGNQPPRQRPFWTKRNSILATALFTVVALTAWLLSHFLLNREVPADKSVAVLPFVDMTPEHNMEYFGDGIADEIINSLTTINNLKVAGRTSSFQFKNEKIDLRSIGEKLGVGYVLEGSIQKYEGNLRITAQLVRTSDNFHAWSKRFDMQEMNIFRIQDAIAGSIVDELQITLSSGEKGRITAKEISTEAYNEYLKGMYQYKADNYRPAIPFLKRVIDLAPSYAPAYAYLGIAVARSIDRSNSDSVKVALQYAERAVEIDPDLPEGYSALGLINWTCLHDFARARNYFEKSIALNPSISLTKNRYGYFLTWMADFARSSQMAREAMDLDPVDFNSYFLLLDSAYYNGDVRSGKRILAEYQKVFGKNSFWVRRSIQLDYLENHPRRVIERYDSLVRSGKVPEDPDLSLLARCYFKAGKPHASDSILALMRRQRPDKGNHYFEIARVFAVQGKADSCFRYLDLSVNRFELGAVIMKIEPEFVPFRNDPRYLRLYEKVGLAEYDRLVTSN